MKAAWFAAWLFGLLTLSLAAKAHEVRPGYFRIEQASGETRVTWRRPRTLASIPLAVQLPGHCRRVSGPHDEITATAIVERSTFLCGGRGLAGYPVAVAGLEHTITDVLLEVQSGSQTYSAVLSNRSPSAFVPTHSASRPPRTLGAYVHLGLLHVLLGIDHLLFLLGLTLLAGRFRRVVGTVTAFTAAHSLTLAATVLDWVRVPQPPVEAAIALSIVFVARELLVNDQKSISNRHPWMVALVFGLVHGFGFAGAISEIGFPRAALLQTLAAFNLGVELGQLLVVTALLLTAQTLPRALPHLHLPVARLPPWRWTASYALGIPAAILLIDRLASFG